MKGDGTSLKANLLSQLTTANRLYFCDSPYRGMYAQVCVHFQIVFCFDVLPVNAQGNYDKDTFKHTSPHVYLKWYILQDLHHLSCSTFETALSVFSFIKLLAFKYVDEKSIYSIISHPSGIARGGVQRTKDAAESKKFWGKV